MAAKKQKTKVKFGKFNARLDLLLVALAVLVVGVWLIFKTMSNRAALVEYEPSFTEKQLEMEESLAGVDASLDQPKVVLDPYNLSPLTAVVLFKTDQPVAPELTVIGKDELTTFSHSFEQNTEHRLPVYGLYPDAENKVLVKVGDIEKEITIKTKPLPENFAQTVATTANKEKLTNELYFMTGSSTGSTNVAYDVNGDVRWYLTERLGWETKRSTKTGKLLASTERLNSKPYYRTGIYEIDLLGKVYAEYTVPGGYHHDVFERSNGNLIVASGSTEPDRKTVEDVVVEIDRQTGEVVKEIDLSKIWPMDTGKSISWSAGDWFHNNSVWLDEKTNELLLSGRHQDAVVALDYATDKIKYIIGSPDSWSAEMQQYFLKPVGDNFEWQWVQHAAKVMPNGDILIFDNGNNKSKHISQSVPIDKTYSRAVIYRVDRDQKTIEQIWQYGKERGVEYFSPYISEADYLGDNHFLVHSGGVNYKDGSPTNRPASLADADKLRSFTTEVLDGEVVFEVVNDKNQYRAEKMPAYTKHDTGLILGEAVKYGNQAPTNYYGDIPVKLAIKPDEVYQTHKIELKRQFDRLVMKGTFDKKDVVRLALVGGGKQYTYRMPVESDNDSKALCVDIMNHNHQKSGETADAENYVNAKGLSGKFKIYISIQDRVYDTGYKVRF